MPWGAIWARVPARLASILVFHKSLQIAQIELPEPPVLFEPGINRFEWSWVQLVKAVAAATMFEYKARFAQLPKVFRNRWTGYGKGLCDVTRWLLTLAEEIQNSAAGGIGERMERELRRICNRSVPHDA